MSEAAALSEYPDTPPEPMPLLQVVEARIAQAGISLDDMGPRDRPKVTDVAGDTLAQYTKRSIHEYMRTHPGEAQPFLVIPGSTIAGVRQISRETGYDEVAPDSYRQARARRLMNELASIAIKHGREFPEAAQAARIQRNWRERELTEATTAITALMAGYGRRINTALLVRRQMQLHMYEPRLYRPGIRVPQDWAD